MDLANDFVQTSLNDLAGEKERRYFESKKNLLTKVEGKESSEDTLVKDESIFSRDVDLWIYESPTEAGLQATSHPLHPVTERSMTTVQSSVLGFWHIVAIVMQLLNININYLTLSLRTVLNTADTLYSRVERVYDEILFHLVQFAEGPVFKEIVSVVMDLILVLYAFGFIVFSMYEAAIIR